MHSLWRNVLGGTGEDEEDVLRNIRLFHELNRRDIAVLQRLLHRREYISGESIFTQGEPGLGMYIIAKGQVSIQTEPSGRELVELKDGDFFGEIALLNEVIRSATARAKSDCLLLSLFQPDLLGLLERNPRLGVKILLSLAQLVGMRLVEVSDEMEELRKDSEGRLEKHDGSNQKSSTPLDHPISDDDAESVA